MISSRAAYELWHSKLDVDVDTDAPWHRMIKRHLMPDRDLKNKRVLEIGCGRGGFSCWLARQPNRPSEIVAADFAATAVRKAEAFAAENEITGITWQVCDIQSIPYAQSAFDTVISCETIEHVPNPRVAIRELARVLKPGGRLLVTSPNYLGVFGLYRGYLRLLGRRFTEEGQPINNFLVLPRTRSWLRQSGLSIKVVDAEGHYLLLPGRPPREIPALNHPRTVMRWFAYNSLIIAEKFVA